TMVTDWERGDTDRSNKCGLDLPMLHKLLGWTSRCNFRISETSKGNLVASCRWSFTVKAGYYCILAVLSALPILHGLSSLPTMLICFGK
ncbi:hypothetical protein, partial [Sphingorhabdus sp.]|uniref:hypothetical protein n=1 Tax=Sphingorhabdus sp. TaxID=1902408 RepID=UPI003BB17D58